MCWQEACVYTQLRQSKLSFQYNLNEGVCSSRTRIISGLRSVIFHNSSVSSGRGLSLRVGQRESFVNHSSVILIYIFIASVNSCRACLASPNSRSKTFICSFEIDDPHVTIAELYSVHMLALHYSFPFSFHFSGKSAEIFFAEHFRPKSKITSSDKVRL